MSEDLKPCPFCGNTPQVEKWEEGWYVECMNKACDVEPVTRDDFETKAAAIAAWNKRVPDA